MPHFNPDLDGPDPPPAVAAFRARLAAADGLLISSPEYAHGVPGVLKNALDWLVSGIEAVAMPVMLLNASPRATHAQASLIETLRTMAMEVVDGRPFDVPTAGRPLDLGGVLADPELVAAIQTALGALLAACARSREAGRRLVP
jgi:NAD(P)H-dependent FMN reductase